LSYKDIDSMQLENIGQQGVEQNILTWKEMEETA
jgi:hypothetical protein